MRQGPAGLPRRLRVAVVVDANSRRDLRWKPFQVSAFWRKYWYKPPVFIFMNRYRGVGFLPVEFEGVPKNSPSFPKK